MRTHTSIALLAALALVACDKGPPQIPAPRPFVVDGEGSHYILDDPARGRFGAATLASIPTHHRGVVRVRHDAWAPVSATLKGSWVVDAIDAKPGDALLAVWRPERAILGAQLAQNRAYHAALDAHFVASEMAVVHPESARNKRALKLRTLLPKQDKSALTGAPPLPSDTP